MSKLKSQVLTKMQLRRMLALGYLSAKGKKVAKEVLLGKHNATRRK